MDSPSPKSVICTRNALYVVCIGGIDSGTCFRELSSY